MAKDVAVVVVGIALLGVVWIGWGQFESWRVEVYGEKPIACTLDAKLCPDGSYVGREGPECEFAVCPQ